MSKTTEFDSTVVWCLSCEEPLTPTEQQHSEEDYGHQGFCCECYDLSLGVPAEKLNKARARKGRAPYIVVK